MDINKKIERKWQEWETMMENAHIFLTAARDLGSVITDKDDNTVAFLSCEKIQITIDTLEEAKKLVEKLEFFEEIEKSDMEETNK